MVKEIAVASTSVHKIKAATRAAEWIFPGEQIIVKGYPADSGINAQPYGLHETMQGARNRLEFMLSSLDSTQYHVALAIESGLFPEVIQGIKHYVDHAVVIALSHRGHMTTKISKGVEFPKKEVEELMNQGGFTTKVVGDLLHERNSQISASDPHTFLTNGEHSREELLTETIIAALQNIRGRI